MVSQDTLNCILCLQVAPGAHSCPGHQLKSGFLCGLHLITPCYCESSLLAVLGYYLAKLLAGDHKDPTSLSALVKVLFADVIVTLCLPES